MCPYFLPVQYYGVHGCHIGPEFLGVKSLLEEINVSVALLMRATVDNQKSLIHIENEVATSALKHVDVKMKFVRDTSSKGIVKPEDVSTKEMIAELLTKSLPAPRFVDLQEMMELNWMRCRGRIVGSRCVDDTAPVGESGIGEE